MQQYNVVQWWSAISNGAIQVTTAVSTSSDIFQVQLASAGTSCASWHSIILSAFRAAGGTGTYDSFMWVFPDGFSVTGCPQTDTNTASVQAQVGPCAGGCYNMFYGCPFINSYIFAIGRNKGLSRSNALSTSGSVLTGTDYSCQMGFVLTTAPTQRRGFNALKLRNLGLITAQQAQSTAFTQFLAATYENSIAGAVKLIQLTGTNFYVSFRSILDKGVDRVINYGAKYLPTGQGSIGGVTLVHLLNADGSSTLYTGIATGSTYTIPGTNWKVKQVWANYSGAMISVSSTGVLLSDPPAPAVTIPASGSAYWNCGLLDTAEQGSSATSFAYGASPQLNMCWNGDDRNNTSFMRLQVNVPQGSTISKATLTLEADVEQLQASAGTTKIYISVESTDNAAVVSGNALARNPYVNRVQSSLTGDWEAGDEFSLDVTGHVQTIVNRAGFVAGNYINIAINSAVSGQTFTRTVQSGSYCSSIGSIWYCGPRISINYTSGNGGQPAPIDCQYTWSVWSDCTGGACGGTGTQTRSLIILQQPANGGAACPTTTIQTQACQMAACTTTPKDCIWSWGPWSTCTGPCSSFGTQTRNVIITQYPDPGGAACPTVLTETSYTCSTAACPPVDCAVQWSAWSTCAGTCGSTGTQNRTGTIITPAQYGGAACPTLFQTQSCTTAPCSQDCIVTYDANWSSCIGACGGVVGYQQKAGTVTQQQLGSGAPCPSLLLTQSCITAPCASQDCVYSWSYSACTGGPCGGTGTQTRTPVVTTQASGSGAPCPSTQTVSCTMPSCAVGAQVVLPFAFSATSGSTAGPLSNVNVVDNVFQNVTESSRTIDITYSFYVPDSTRLDLDVMAAGQNLAGQSLRFTWSFLGMTWVSAVNVSSSTSARSTVTISSTSTARQMLYVRITNSDTTTFRTALTVLNIDYLAINAYPSSTVAPVDCVQGDWVTSDCSTHCGVGTQTVSRPTLQQPANGGAACGSSSYTQSCSDYSLCPVNCVLSGWSSYSACSATCGVGQQTRTRSVLVQPSNGGALCDTNLTDTISCISPITCTGSSCIWSNWSPWSTCTASCGGGTQYRTRVISYNGTFGGCIGSTTDTQACNTQSCTPVTTTFTMNSSLQQDQASGVYYQAWSTTAIPVATGVNLVAFGRATDISSFQPANAYWQLIFGAGAKSCTTNTVSVSCPSGSVNTSSNVGGIVGRLSCSNSVGMFQASVTATFTITC